MVSVLCCCYVKSGEALTLKISKRIKKIESMVVSGYDHIWDCCCDHGFIGAALLARQAAPHIHFADKVPELMHQLENKLRYHFAENESSASAVQWKTHCIDVSSLPLQNFTGRHLVVIAGVGGNLMTKLVKNIYQKNPSVEFDFLLCATNNQFVLRQQLMQCNVSLKAEKLIAENKRFYEIMLVSTKNQVCDTNFKVSPVGNLIWRPHTREQEKICNDYLQKMLAHYKRMALNPHSNVQYIIDAYSAIGISEYPPV